jgi:hypothetical protein
MALCEVSFDHWSRFIDRERSAIEFFTVQLRDCLFSLVVAHCNEAALSCWQLSLPIHIRTQLRDGEATSFFVRVGISIRVVNSRFQFATRGKNEDSSSLNAGFI